MELEEILEKLSKTKGWELYGPNKAIRRVSRKKGRHLLLELECPISALKKLPVSDAFVVASAFGIKSKLADRVAYAADYNLTKLKVLRAQLLKACHLEGAL